MIELWHPYFDEDFVYEEEDDDDDEEDDGDEEEDDDDNHQEYDVSPIRVKSFEAGKGSLVVPDLIKGKYLAIIQKS